MSDSIIQLNEDLIKNNLKDLVRSSVEETLNALLDYEADGLVNADKYERSGDRKGYRSGHYERKFSTTSGDVTLKIPKLKGIQFETAIIERYKRRECSVEEALIEMYLAGVSVRRVEDITEALWGSKVSPGTISNLNKKAYEHIEEWRSRSLTEEYPYVYVDGVYLKRSWGGEIQNVAVLVAIGVNKEGYREVLGAAEGMKEDHESWKNCFVWLKERGLKGVRLIIGDKCLGMLKSIPEVFPEARYQRCTVHFYRNVFTVTPRTKMRTNNKGNYEIQKSAVIKQEHVRNGKWDLNIIKKCNNQELDFRRGTISSNYFIERGIPVLHTAKAAVNWKPQIRYIKESPRKKVYADHGDIIVSRIGKSAGLWCIHSGNKMLISDCLFCIKDSDGKLAKKMSGKEYSYVVKGVATQYITISDFKAWYNSL